MKKYILSLIFLAGLPLATLAVDDMKPQVKIFNTQLKEQKSFLAMDGKFKGGMDVAIADVNGDGKDEIIIAAGKDGGPMIQVYNRKGKLLSQFFAYDQNIKTGVQVAAGDLDGDGKAEIVTGTEYKAGPQVRVFDMKGNSKFTVGFFAFDQAFRGGVDIAVGNFDGKGKKMEIAAAAGPSGSPHVRVFDRFGNYLGADFRPFASGNKGGVSLTSANVDGGKDDELVMSIKSGGEGWVKVYKLNGTILGEWKAFGDLKSGVIVGAGDIDKDGKDEVMVTPRQSAGPQVQFFEGHGTKKGQQFFAYNEDFRGGVRVASGDLNGDGKDEFITVPNKNRGAGPRPDLLRYIHVDLSEQHLYVYEYGEVVKDFAVSTGIARFPTPVGTYAVQQKIYSKTYKWDYGPNNPDNYDIKNVKWNLRYSGPLFLHGAYWHNNFGQPMSHGCTNISYANAEWLYNWGNVGDVVINTY